MEEIKPQVRGIREQEVLLKNRDKWLLFTEPYCLIAAETLDDVLPAMGEIERLIGQNHWHAAGFVSYEAASAFDPALKTYAPIALRKNHSSPRAEEASELPYLWFGLYPAPRPFALPRTDQATARLNWKPTIDRTFYNRTIEKIKDHIARGRTYQVNYTMRLETDFTGEAWDFFLRLAQDQNQHAAYVDTGSHAICSASPELFFQLDGDTIICRPMKGTTRRGRTTAEDNERSAWLINSEKDRAENVMIVDMIRNDLGRIAETGTVKVPELFATERYPTLWQMTSTVTAKTNASLTEIFTALFPCASITGAPKVSTMGIIAELENAPRRIYTGSIGHISPERTAKFNVAIRTALIDRQRVRAEYGVGGGVVWDSTSRDEYAEAFLKARLLTDQPLPFSLLETMRWTPAEGFFLLDKHIARMLDSANYFDIPITKQKLEEVLSSTSSSFHAPRRVRLLLQQSGELQHESQLFTPARSSHVLNVCLARQPVDSVNVFLFHKTTQRAVYDAARRGLEKFEDVLLYNEDGELTEFTMGNLVVELEGRLLTPPVACGLLAGTFRAQVVETGQVLERTIPLEQLPDCTKLFRINSIRGWQRVRMQPAPLREV